MNLPAHNTSILSSTAIELLAAGHSTKIDHVDLDNPCSIGDVIDLGRFVVRVEAVAPKCRYGRNVQELTVRVINHGR